MSADLDLRAARADIDGLRRRLALMGDERDRAVADASQARQAVGAAEYRIERSEADLREARRERDSARRERDIARRQLADVRAAAQRAARNGQAETLAVELPAAWGGR